jgi:hypothetical protein
MIQGSNQHYCSTVAQLTGKELLSKVKELGDATPKDQVARETGYSVTKKDGTERIEYTAFYEALLEAKGLALAPAVTSRPGRQLSYKAKVQANGNLIVSAGYTALQGAEAGHEFTIQLLDGGCIMLAPIYEDDVISGAADLPESTEPAAA